MLDEKEIQDFQNEHKIISRSPLIKKIVSTIIEIAKTDISILIMGESGTGKEVFAQAIHNASKRKNKRLVAVNCAAIPESILESELFGHEKGSFTGAQNQRKGYFEQADGGTIFLDEIGEMPVSVQVKLLRVLETREIMRVGSENTQKVDVRVIAATNAVLEKEVAKGNFREDLFYRLNTVKLKLPPLRERKEDIPLLADFFVQSFARANDINFVGISRNAYLALMNYSWRGNIRELKNIMESICVLERDELVTPEVLQNYLPKEEGYNINHNLPVTTGKTSEQAEREVIYRSLLLLKAEISEIKEILLLKGKQQQNFHQTTPLLPQDTETFTEQIDEFDVVNKTTEEDSIVPIEELTKNEIYKALRITNQSRRKAAQLLGISERTLYRKIDEYEGKKSD
ncbi:sigma-54-dependent Fis family transcriptional regulator [bacterium]|nr:sigma-54-dependent Fis family transcriptional regulator [bacterium]